ncbi:hypothetical protein NFI95_14190 [Acetobacteraceae bacterium KSS8]|uniref:Uncharacterized protein n=1 Tax=Endosaccharibacter trunci TaxID=2812733 RepID=A0ABT1W9M3_9PROT|nr:hypothetical protein [Acetobacteraceae bacterium KSS8]
MLLVTTLIDNTYAAPVSIPAGAPRLEAFQAAAFSSVNPGAAPGGGLAPAFLPSGQATISTANGVTAVAYLDARGNVLSGSRTFPSVRGSSR